MRAGRVYRHRNTLDTDIYVNKVVYSGKDYVKIKYTIFNRHNGLVYNDIPVKATITREAFLKNWKEVK